MLIHDMSSHRMVWDRVHCPHGSEMDQDRAVEEEKEAAPVSSSEPQGSGEPKSQVQQQGSDKMVPGADKKDNSSVAPDQQHHR